MTNPQTEARAIARYEVFADPSYYDLWAVRPVGEQSFNATIHAASHAEAEAIATVLAAKDAELAAVHQQYVDANEARIDAEASLAEARKALTDALAFIDKTSGTALGIAMSGNDHPDPDGVLCHLSQEGMTLSESIRAARRAHKGGAEHG